MKTLEMINDADVLKAALKIWGKDYAIQEFNDEVKRFISCLEDGTMYAFVVKQSFEYDRVKLLQISPANRYFYNFNAFLSLFGFKVRRDCSCIFPGCQVNTVFNATYHILRKLLKMGAISETEFEKYQRIEIPRIFA